jgi:hypothetical protein
MLWIATEGTPATAGMPTAAGTQASVSHSSYSSFQQKSYAENCLWKTPKNHIKIAQTLD